MLGLPTKKPEAAQTLNTYEQDLWKKKEFIFAANDRMKLLPRQLNVAQSDRA